MEATTQPTETTPPLPKTLFAKMSRVMGKMNRIPKNGKNAHFGYPFATESDIADEVRKAMSEENLCLFVQILEVKQEGKRTRVVFEFIFACGDTGQTHPCRWESEADDGQDKGIAKAATAALKYFLLKTFIISTGKPEDDTDSGADSGTPEGGKKQPPENKKVAENKAAEAKRAQLIKLLAELYGDNWQVEEEALAKLISNGKATKLIQLAETQLEGLINKTSAEIRKRQTEPKAQPSGK